MSILGWALGLAAFNALTDAEEKSEEARRKSEETRRAADVPGAGRGTRDGQSSGVDNRE